MSDPLDSLLPDPSQLAELWPAAQRRLILRLVAKTLEVFGAREPELQQPAADGNLLTMPEVAKRLGVPNSEAYALGRDGLLPVVRIGKYVRARPVDVDAFIAAHRDPTH